MAIELTTLSELDSTKVDAMVAKLAQYMQEQHPEVELTRGVFHDLVLYFNGVLNAAIQENIDRVRQSQSLYAISQNPALADDAIVDQVLSNYNLTRSAGKPATGLATIILNLPLTTKFAATDTMLANNVAFNPAASFVALPPGSNAVTDNDKVMVPVGDGTYAITIPMVAATPGVAGNIRRSATLRPNFVPNNTLSIYAASDFVGGEAAPTNAAYIQQLPAALAAKTVGSRQSYVATIKAQAAFQNTLHVSVMGCGDPEQQRDQHSLFPVSGGGKVDIYAQTSPYAQENDHLLEATYIGPGTSGTVWQVILDKNTAPGFYEIRRVAQPNDKTSSGYAILADDRDVNLADALFVPDVRYLTETAYTRYQTAAIRFEDVDKTPVGLVPNVTRAYYSVRTASLPLIGEINDFLTARDSRPRGTDILVKAAVPCFTKIAFQIRTETNDVIADSTLTAIKQAVVDAVAGVGFSGQLHASLIDKAVHGYLSGRQAVGKIDMFGRIRRPDGAVTYIRDPAILRIPDDAARMVTGRTTVFLVGVDDVSVSTAAAGFLS
jgi:hypothetical protein